MRLPALLCVAALTLGGCYDSRFSEAGGSEAPPASTTTLGVLRNGFAGKTYQITSDVVVTGIVTTSDRSQNFFRTLCIEQEGAALEVMAGVDHLHTGYPIGCAVTLRLKGLAVGMSRGVLQVGRMPAAGSGYATDYIGSPAALAGALVRNSETTTGVLPATRTLGELTSAMGGTLVRIGGLHYTPEDLSTGTWTGYQTFTNDLGDTIRTYVRTYAAFAGREIPAGVCTLTGILQYDGAEGYLLKLRDENDCMY